MKKAIFAAGIVLAASLALTGCAGAPRQIRSTGSAKHTMEAVEAATACTQTVTAAKSAPGSTTPAVTTAKSVQTTTVTTAKPVQTTAATTAKPVQTTTVTTAKPVQTTTVTTAATAATTATTATTTNAVDEVMKQLISAQNAAEQKALVSAGAGSAIVSTESLPGTDNAFRIGVRSNGSDQVVYYHVSKDACTVEGADLTPAPERVQPSQNPIMNFIGNYGNGRATMHVSESGKDGAGISVTWSGSAADSSTWTMSGTVTALGDCIVVDYTDCVKESFSYDANGNVLLDIIDYTNGCGSLTFNGSSVTWTDYEEQIADGSVFAYYR